MPGQGVKHQGGGLVEIHLEGMLHHIAAGLCQGDVFQHIVPLGIFFHPSGIPVVDHMLGPGHIAGGERDHFVIGAVQPEPVGVVALFLKFLFQE